MESKKRKRETEPPRVTYDAATRTFDRLFKEDSLNAMKAVVRKKLGLSGSAPVHLSQWREGKAVDLEDDEDFEAFSAAARSSTAVVVKVILGENQALLTSEENETPSTSKRKRKKKSNRDGSVSPPAEEPSEDRVVPTNPSETLPVSKKRRVSFAADAPDVEILLGEKLKKKDTILESTNVPTTEPEQEKETTKKKKKKSKKNKATDKQPEGLTSYQIKSNEDQPTSGKEGEQKSIADSSVSRGIFDDTRPDATATKLVELTQQPKKSKKRSRTGTASESDAPEDIPTAEHQQPTPTSKTDDDRPTKKAKKKAVETPGSETVAAVVTDDTSNIAKSTSLTQLPSSQLPSTPTDAATEEPAKKSRKRKQKSAAEPEDKIGSEKASESSAMANTLEDTTSSKSSKKSSMSKVADTVSSDKVVTETAPTAQPVPPPPASKNLTTSAVPTIEEPEKAAKVKKSKTSKEKADATKPTENSSESKDVAAHHDANAQSKAKKSKEKGKDSENPVVVVAEDNINASGTSVAKTSKKGGKQKKNGTDAVEQPGPTEGESTEQTNASQSDMKEATRQAVLNVLKKAAEKMANKNSSSSPVSASSSSTQPPPISSESSSADTAPLHVALPSPLVVQSTGFQPPSKAPPTSENSKSVEKPLATPSKSAKESSMCPICETSPFHARTRCPIIKSGIRAMRKKIAELEKETSEEGAESRSSVIHELQGIIDRRTKKPRVSDVAKSIAAPDVGSESTEKEVEAPALGPIGASESLVESEGASTSASRPEPVPVPKLPPNKPISARLLLSQKSAQPVLSSHAISSQKASNTAQTSKSVVPKPIHTAEAALAMNLSGFGDVSLFTDQDLDALIRGPRLSVKNVVPNSETEEESEQEEDVILEEGVVVEDKSTRNASRVEYPSSSNEGDEEEEEEAENPAVSLVDTTHPASAAVIEEADVVDNVEDSRNNLSFHEINALGSSVEPDRTGDIAVHAAVGADLVLMNALGLSQRDASKDADQSSDATDSQAPSPTEPQTPAEVVEDFNVDPIESSDIPAASQPDLIDPIASDDDMPPMESTPKSEAVVRTRSQRSAATKKAPASQSKVNGSTEAQVEGAPKPRTRSLTKITDLPVPPNPSIRVIRQATVTTPRTRRQLAQEQNKEREVMPEETEVAGRTRRAAAAAKAKTPAKAPAKTPAKTPAKGFKTTAKPLSKQGKTVAVNNVDDVTTAKSADSVAPAKPEHGSSQVPSFSANAKNVPTASWAVLQESAPSQLDTDNGGMIDELLSSPTVMPLTSPREHGGKGQKSTSVNGSQQDPLFIPTESQQSFPYSQYALLPPKSQAVVSPNDSDDENEVAAAVVTASSAPTKKTYRSLKEIASQPTLFAPRLSQIMKPVSEPQGEDLFGRNGRESEESDSDTDSDDDEKPVSHIPASRRAGVSQPKNK